MLFEAGAKIEAYDDAIMDFDLTQTAAGADALENDLSFVMNATDLLMNAADFTYTLTVDGTQANGLYSLAGGAAGFNNAITVKNTVGETLGTLTVDGGTKTIDGGKYTLIRDEDELSLLIGDPLPPEPDNNDLVFKGKNDNDNKAVTGSYGNRLKAAGQEIRLDQIDSIDHEGYCNRVEKAVKGEERDTIDYAKIVLAHGAKLSFHAVATAAATFTVYSLTQDKKGKYTLKKLQTLKLTDKDKDGVFTADSKKPVSLSVSGPYYVSMQFADKKAEETYFNVSLNGEDKTKFYDDGDNGWNNWLCEKSKCNADVVSGDAVNVWSLTKAVQVDDEGISHIYTYTDADEKEKEIEFNNFVGFGDDADYRRITLNSPAKLSFTVTATDKAKIVICRLDEKDGKYTLKKLQTTVLTLDKTTGLYKVDTAACKLPANLPDGTSGEYYICVQSTNAKKGGEAYYNVQLNTSSDEPKKKSKFYIDSDDGTNGWLYNKKTDKEHYNANLYANEIGPGSEQIYLETYGSGFQVMIDVDGEYRTYNDFVGFGDERDYAEIVVSAPGTCTFSLDVYGTANSSSKFTVYSLTWNESKKAWTQKALTTKTVKIAKKEDHVDGVATKAVNFEVATDEQTRYFVSMQSTGAKNGDEVYYNVTAAFAASESSALAMPETDSLGISDVLSFGGYDADALADASASSLAELDDKSVWRNTASLA